MLQCISRDFSTNSHDIFNVVSASSLVFVANHFTHIQNGCHELYADLQHKHNPDNNWETPFDFTDENYETVSGLASLHVHCYLSCFDINNHDTPRLRMA